MNTFYFSELPTNEKKEVIEQLNNQLARGETSAYVDTSTGYPARMLEGDEYPVLVPFYGY